MKHRILFISTSIILLIIGLLYLIIPDVTIKGLSKIPEIPLAMGFVIRWWGAAMIGLALVLIFALKADAASIGIRAIYIGSFVTFLLSFIIAIAVVLWGTPKVTIWIIVALLGIIAAWFGYFVFAKRPTQAA